METAGEAAGVRLTAACALGSAEMLAGAELPATDAGAGPEVTGVGLTGATGAAGVVERVGVARLGTVVDVVDGAVAEVVDGEVDDGGADVGGIEGGVVAGGVELDDWGAEVGGVEAPGLPAGVTHWIGIT